MTYYKNLYLAILPIPFTLSSMFGIIIGVNHGLDKKNHFDSFSGMIGFSSLGMITGITYPISFPILAGYILLKKIKED